MINSVSKRKRAARRAALCESWLKKARRTPRTLGGKAWYRDPSQSGACGSRLKHCLPIEKGCPADGSPSPSACHSARFACLASTCTPAWRRAVSAEGVGRCFARQLANRRWPPIPRRRPLVPWGGSPGPTGPPAAPAPRLPLVPPSPVGFHPRARASAAVLGLARRARPSRRVRPCRRSVARSGCPRGGTRGRW